VIQETIGKKAEKHFASFFKAHYFVPVILDAILTFRTVSYAELLLLRFYTNPKRRVETFRTSEWLRCCRLHAAKSDATLFFLSNRNMKHF